MRFQAPPHTVQSLAQYKDATMSKKDLIDAVAAATELPKDRAGVAVDAVIAHIEGSMRKGEEVRIPGFGTFKVSERKARKARNPQTGVEMMLKASRVPKFQASKTLKELLN
jgi:DNA-binding protein HU-beta